MFKTFLTISLTPWQHIPWNGINNVSTHTTGSKLFLLVKSVLQDSWDAATHCFPLEDHRGSLRDKSDVNLKAAYPDTPAIYHQCLSVGVAGKGCFGPGKTITATVKVTANAFAVVQAHIDDWEAQVGLRFNPWVSN
jgi:hypothetical protein